MERAEALPLLGFRRRAPHACPASAAVQRVCRERASKRWSALLTQTKSRIRHRCGMRKRLGEVHWAAFVRYAETEHKAKFFRALAPASGELRCEGKLDGTPCPNGARIDLRQVSSIECGAAPPGLHMDHTYDVQHICAIWSRALPVAPSSWDDGICGALVAQLLFGTEDHVLAQCSTRRVWRRQILLRCGNTRGSIEPQHADEFCHDVAGAHYEHALQVEDLRWPVISDAKPC
eukprot:scaffold98229_cov76-Phaeocystis_antarctica.AAC.4